MWDNNYNSGGKHRFLTLTYLILYNLSLAPTAVAPPEREISKGQPEMQQAMDNMVSHGAIVKKNHLAPSTEVNYPAMLTSKTSSLLAEAEQVLSKLPHSKEKQWVEGFVDRMRAIADMLEKTAKNGKHHSNSVSGTPVPVGLPDHPTWPATSAVPGFNPFQKTSRMMSKFQVTSPELSKVLPINEYPTELQVVTKPALLSNKKEDEDDELVRELKSLQLETASKVSYHNPMGLERNPDMTSPATPDSVSARNGKESIENADIEKNKLKTRLIQEIAEFQRLGGVLPKEITKTLYEDDSMKSDYNSPNATSKQNQNNGRNKSEIMNDYTMKDTAIGKLNDIQEQHASKPNMNNLSSEGKMPYQTYKQNPFLKPNFAFQNTHMKFYPNQPAFPRQLGNYFHQTTQTKQEQFPENVENTMKNFKNPTPFNMHGNHMNSYPANEQSTQIPDIIKQKMSESNYKARNEYWHAYQDDLIIPRFPPYPYMHQNNKTMTLNKSPMISSYITKPSMNHQIDTQLSDEMKRQLRDGKIIVLSDSLVRSNFEQNQGNEGGTNNPKSSNMNNINGTQIPN